MENKPKAPKKKVVVTTKSNTKTNVAERVLDRKKGKSDRGGKVKAKSSVRQKAQEAKEELVFGKENYILMGAGVGLIFLGMVLMLGGKMPSSDVWDPNIIYSFSRTVLAPIVILAGLVVEIFAIFRGYKI